MYSLNRGSQNMVSLVVDNVQNKGFHAQLNHGQRQRFTRKRGKNLVYTGGGATITFRNEFRKVNYRGQDGIGYELTRGSADDIVGGGTFSHSALRGEWNMRVPGGRTVVEDVTDSNAEKIEVKRAGTEFVRTYNLTGDRNDGTYEYTSDAGGRFRFISPTRGIWISGDGQTVFQMQKK